jgi:hypothetical protein
MNYFRRQLRPSYIVSIPLVVDKVSYRMGLSVKNLGFSSGRGIAWQSNRVEGDLRIDRL